jgi:hypothetical protein
MILSFKKRIQIHVLNFGGLNLGGNNLLFHRERRSGRSSSFRCRSPIQANLLGSFPIL